MACLCDRVEIADILLRRLSDQQKNQQKNPQETVGVARKPITLLPDIFGYLPMNFCQSRNMVELLNDVSFTITFW